MKKTNKQDELTVRRKKKTKKLITRIVVLTFAAGFFVWFAVLKNNVDTQANSFDFVVPFEEREVNSFICSSGMVEMSDAQVVSADISQKVKTICCKVGDFVNEGDVLCEFESDDLNSQIETYQKMISDAQTLENMQNSNSVSSDDFARRQIDLQLSQASLAASAAEKQYDMTYSKYAEYYTLYYNCEDPVQSDLYMKIYKSYEDQLEPLRNNMLDAEKSYQEAKESAERQKRDLNNAHFADSFRESSAKELQNQLDKLNKEKENLIIKAPRSGIISAIYISEGGYAANGDLFRIGSLGDYKVEVNLSASNILDIREGMNAEFTTTLTGEKVIKGVISSVSEVYGEKGYSATIKITDKDLMADLKPNIAAFVKIFTFEHENVPAVPFDAIFSDKDGNKWVFVARGPKTDLKAKKVSVKTGIESDYYVEITESELKEGDLIIGDGKEHKDGDRIKIRS